MYSPSETQSPFSNYGDNSVHYMLIQANYSQQDRKCFSKGLLPINRFVGLFVLGGNFWGVFVVGDLFSFVLALFKRLFHLTGQNLRVFSNLTSRHSTPVNSMRRKGLPENISQYWAWDEVQKEVN